MALIDWSEMLSVGVAEFDAEHKMLVRLLNDLFEAIQRRSDREVLGRVLDELVNYAEKHFRHEENVFFSTGYPDAHTHGQAHDELERQVADFRRRYTEGPTPELSLETGVFLKNWLVEHIMGTDKKYTAFLNSKGIR